MTYTEAELRRIAHAIPGDEGREVRVRRSTASTFRWKGTISCVNMTQIHVRCADRDETLVFGKVIGSTHDGLWEMKPVQ